MTDKTVAGPATIHSAASRSLETALDQSVVAVFDSLGHAENAVRLLDRAGFPMRQISIVAQNLQDERDVQGYLTTGNLTGSGAAGGAGAGGIFGLLLGSAFLWMPAFGPLFVRRVPGRDGAVGLGRAYEALRRGEAREPTLHEETVA